MTDSQRLKNMSPAPELCLDAVLDTDAYNEIDDQFAIAYLLKKSERISLKAIYAAPFHNEKSLSYGDGMHKSYAEIKKILTLMGREDMSKFVFRGSERQLQDEKTAIISDAALDLAKRAMDYTPEHPLYVIAIGAITNIASAILLSPEIIDRIVVVWLGANAHHYPDNREFNLLGDIAAARAVALSGVPYVQVPCMGVVSAFTVSEPELRHWLSGKNPLCDYLVENTVAAAEKYASGKPWTRVIWDVCAAAYLTGGDKFMISDVRELKIPTYDCRYQKSLIPTPQRYVNHIWRDALFEELILTLTKES